MRQSFFKCLFPFILILMGTQAFAQKKVANIRKEISLNEAWTTVMDTSKTTYDGFEKSTYAEQNWRKVDVPHNWEDYQGYRRMKHGSLHGIAWYRKSFSVAAREKGKRYFLFFEGVSSYATVWVNGTEVGKHAGGRTTFTIDVTDALKFGSKNLLAVRADHPAEIRDLPWVCGGCSSEWGFSEGSQPMGIFRPVTLTITGDLRIEPFGVHVWNSDKISQREASLSINTEVRNYTDKLRQVTVTQKLLSPNGKSVTSIKNFAKIDAGGAVIVKQDILSISNPQLWSPEQPNLYSIVTEISEGTKVIDRQVTPYGIRKISWPVTRNNGDGRFFINDKPFFINGVCEYEHNMGQSHAFTDAFIDARVQQILSAGFNSFRDAHQPHNFRYSYHWDRMGIPWWTQFSAHIWFDNPDFRNNFKALLRDWVKERRNSPSVVLWGLQNESTLPTDFAKECADIIRELDPTTSSQRLVTTCNGGTGTDWNVVQNWSGTYGGNPYIYDKEMEKQLLNGEYGAWRSLDMHTEGVFNQKGALSEDRMTQLMELKVRLAEKSKDKICGQYHWLFYTHENPGRTQNGEGLRELDRMGPLNYKGLFTAWGEPTDAYYMFRSNYAPKDKEPMVYISMHTWPDRWTKPGIKDSIVVYSNCDEVELWDDTVRLAKQDRDIDRVGSHFTFVDMEVKSNMLHAMGYVDGKPLAEDVVLLHHLPQASSFNAMVLAPQNITKPTAGYSYLYRVNCGGPNYVDGNGNTWLADAHKSPLDMWGSLSWTDDYPGMPAFFGSQRRTFDIVHGTTDPDLFRTFRYGQHKLRYQFSVPNGDYRVEMYFIEPWYGRAGGVTCFGWRQFDIAVNGVVKVKNFDPWKIAGYSYAVKKTVDAKVTNGLLEISFPKVTSGQAVISAIAIASKNKGLKWVMPPSSSLIANLKQSAQWSVKTWMDTGDKQYADDEICFSALPSNLYGACWLRAPKAMKDEVSFTLTADADVFVGIDESAGKKPAWMSAYNFTQTYVENANGTKFAVYSKRFAKDNVVTLGQNVSSTASTYVVAAVPVTTLESASDLRPVERIEAENAKFLSKGIKADSIRVNKVVRLTETNDAVEFTFSVGVADTYSISIRYMNQQTGNIPMNIQIEDSNGVILHSDKLEFKPTPEDKFKTLGTKTGTQINAGTYKLGLIGAGVAGLVLDYIEIQ